MIGSCSGSGNNGDDGDLKANGISDGELHRAAGIVQKVTGPRDPTWGDPWGSWPYGDEPRDQDMIQLGIDFYLNNYGQNQTGEQSFSTMFLTNPYIFWH